MELVMQTDNSVVETPEQPALALAAYVVSVADEKNIGPVGIGLHGYMVTEDETKRGYGLKNIIPSARGYVKGETKDLRKVHQVFDGIWGELLAGEVATPVVGLILGCVHILNLAVNLKVKSVFIGLPRIRTAAALASGLASLKKSNYKDKTGNLIPYADQAAAFIRAFDLLTEQGVTVTIEHAQETEMGIILAEASANLGLLNTQGGVKAEHFAMTEADGYWNYTHGRHPLLGHPRLVFVGSKSFEKLPEYLCTMDYEKSATEKKDKHRLEIEVGQNLAHARYAVVKPHEIDPLINVAARRHCQHHRTKHSNLAVLYLSALFSKQGHATLSRFGGDVLISTSYLTELLDGRGVMYTHDMPIPRRSLRSAQVYTKMEDALKAFEAAYANEPSSLFTFGCAFGEVTASEITDLLRSTTVNQKGKALHKPNKLIELPNITLDVEGKLDDAERQATIPIKLTIGYDLPTRNTISALLDDEFKAFVLVYRDTEVTVRHLTVIISSKGVGIWTTPFAGRTFTLTK